MGSIGLTRTVVFAGPSLRTEDRAGYAGFEFRAPAAEGDVLRAVAADADRVAIIDGVFADCMAVLHKEILYALSRGVLVYGGASMGALRAAELDVFGMIGVGEIYESFRRGDLVEDEAVALIHGPEESDFRSLTLPTVDALATLDALVQRKRIDHCDALRLREAVRRTHFSCRTWRSVVETAFGRGPWQSRILSILRRGNVERKRLDALMLLDRMVGDEGQRAERRPRPPAPPMTPSFRAALARASELESSLAQPL
jgi:hypothetical protein